MRCKGIRAAVYLGSGAYRGLVCEACGRALVTLKGGRSRQPYRHQDYTPPK